MKKKNRVRKALEFQEIVHKGTKYVNSSFVLYTMSKKEEQARIGVSLSKKMGIAVKRNLYKRQVRMMCQDLVDFHDAELDAIVIVRFGYLGQSYEANKNNLEKLFIKATIM
jgi:ribonuclease P protein component